MRDLSSLIDVATFGNDLEAIGIGLIFIALLMPVADWLNRLATDRRARREIERKEPTIAALDEKPPVAPVASMTILDRGALLNKKVDLSILDEMQAWLEGRPVPAVPFTLPVKKAARGDVVDMEADLIGSLREALIAYAVRMSGNHNLSRAAVRECFPLLLALKAERVSDAKVAGVFNAVGFAISSTTLNRYVRDERAAMGDSPETTRRASPKQATSRRTTAMAQIEVYA